jgi:hypothetical protein
VVLNTSESRALRRTARRTCIGNIGVSDISTGTERLHWQARILSPNSRPKRSAGRARGGNAPEKSGHGFVGRLGRCVMLLRKRHGFVSGPGRRLLI